MLYQILRLWLIFISVLYHFVRCDTPSCKGLIDAHKMRKFYFGDNFLISSLTTQLMNRRRINKYLSHMQTKFMEIEFENTNKSVDTKVNKTEHKNNITESIAESECLVRDAYKSCITAAKKRGTGVYLISSPHIDVKPFMAFCMEDPYGGDAWTLIQRRIDNLTHFDKPWQRYVSGFGDVGHSHWLGLEKIHAITYDKPHELLIELQTKENEKHYAKYSHFAVGGPKIKYALTILGRYEGNLGDALRAHEGASFATKDKFSEGKKNCLDLKKGGWWYKGKAPTCGQCNLNADMHKVYWKNWIKPNHALVESTIAIREKKKSY